MQRKGEPKKILLSLYKLSFLILHNQTKTFQNCGLVLVIVGGLAALQKELEALIESHSKHCPQELQFGKGDQCLVAMCDTCDHCSYIGGF